MRFRNYWLALGTGGVALVVWLSLTPAPVDSGVDHGDKLGHLLAYAGLMGWWGQLHRRWLLLFVLFVALGAAMELLQGLTPTREPSLADMLANTAGAALGWFVTRRRPRWLAGLDAHLARRCAGWRTWWRTLWRA